MKVLAKLALVSAMAISANAMALQAMTDDALSAATGQDGLTVSITPPTGGIKIESIIYHDKDGLTGIAGQTAKSGGAIVLGNGTSQVVVDTSGSPITVNIDADGGTAGASPLLNVNVGLPTSIKISTGDIAVDGSNRNAVGATVAAGTRGVKGNASVILNNIDLNLGGAALNIQLGNNGTATGGQGSLIKLSGELSTGLSISNLSLNDTSGGGSIKVGKISVTDTAGASKLTLNAAVKATASGLEITNNGGAMDVMLETIALGGATAKSIGDVELVGLNLAGAKITVAGH